MTIYTISSLFAFLLSILLSLLVWFKANEKEKRLAFVYTALTAGTWSLFPFVSSIFTDNKITLFVVRIVYLAAIFTGPAFLNFGLMIIGVKKDSRERLINKYGFWSGCIFIPFVFRDLFIQAVYKNLPCYSLKPGPIFILFLLNFFFLCAYVFVRLFIAFINSKGLRRNQYKYIFLAYFLAFVSALIHFATIYGFKEPFPHDFLVIACMGILAYAVVKYRLMNIEMAFVNTGIFLFIYSLCLGIPVWIGFKLMGSGFWLVPLTLMGVFATLGPFIYLYIQKRAEDALLQEQRRYQTTLRQASAGMGKIKDLKKLLSMIVHVLTHAIQIEHALVYIYDEGQKQYVLGASKRKSGHNHFIESIEKNSPLVGYFLENKDSLIFEEIKQKAQDYKDSQLTQIEQIIASLNGELIVPIFIDQNLTAIIVMGKKESGKSYTEDDLAVFSILANQTALAIENAKFYEDMKLTHEQLFQAEKMATIGTMADGLSHQINNRFHSLGFIAGDALDTIRLNQNDPMPDKMKEIMAELERAFVRVQDNVTQGGEVVQGLLKYTRKGEVGFTAVDVEAVFKSALEMAQFKIKTDQLKIIHDYDPAHIPKIKANSTQLQEVFFNLIDNGYDAMMQRKNEKKEPGFQPTLTVRVLKEDGYAQIIFEDNGMGVKEEDVHKLFTPFFTTKLSSKKGTGLGLYVIKKIVEDHHGGTVEMVSKYMRGTQMKLRLPIATG